MSDTFVYVGPLINIKGSIAQEIRRRLAMARGTMENMLSIWKKSRCISLGLKVNFRATDFPTGTYGCESQEA